MTPRDTNLVEQVACRPQVKGCHSGNGERDVLMRRALRVT